MIHSAVQAQSPEELKKMIDVEVLAEHEGVRKVAQHILDCPGCRDHLAKAGSELPARLDNYLQITTACLAFRNCR